MKRSINDILAVWLLIAIGFGFGYLCGTFRAGADALLQNPAKSAPVPTFIEIQTMLANRGYDIGDKGIDGWIGKDTIKAWDLALCNQYAEQYFWDGKDK